MVHKQKKLILQEENFLTPTREAMKIKGKLVYSEGHQAWNTIRLKKEVLQEFPELKNKRSSFNYKMIIPRTPDSVEEFFKELKDSHNLVPILLFFGKEQEE